MAVWVATDLHGNYDLWEQIKNFLKEDDTLIFLGDAIDRGSRGFEIFKELLEHDQVVYLRGNHEQMMYDAYTNTGEIGTKCFKHWMENGGQATLDSAKSLALGANVNRELIQKVETLPFCAEYESKENGLKFILCHAGYSPSCYFDELEEYQKRQKFLWDRNHWNFSWPEEGYDNVVIVHGHTPIPLMNMTTRDITLDSLVPYWYEGNHKVNLDAATANTGIAFLLNLDTLDYKTFRADPDFVDERRR